MDETTIAPDTEVKEVAPLEGTVEAEVAKVAPEPKKQQETVPLAVYLALKDDVKELKREMKEAKSSQKQTVEVVGVRDLADKYPDVSKEFIADILSSATTLAQTEVDRKYTPLIEKQETERKQQVFEQAFNSLFEKTLQDNPDLPKNIDKELVKELAVTAKYRNVPLVDILTKMYGSVEGRTSSETSTRASSDRVEDIVSFDNITPGQKEAIMADSKVRQKYFDYLDTH